MHFSKKALDEKDNLLSKYKVSNDALRKFFICIFNKLSQFSQILSSFPESEDETKSNYSEIISQISKDSKHTLDLFSKVSGGLEMSGQHETVLNSLNELLESIENKFTKLITNLLNTKVNVNQISKLIDDVLNEEMVEFFSKEIIQENKL